MSGSRARESAGSLRPAPRGWRPAGGSQPEPGGAERSAELLIFSSTRVSWMKLRCPLER